MCNHPDLIHTMCVGGCRAGSQALANSIWAVQCLTQQQQQGQPPAPPRPGPVLPAAWQTAFLQALFTEPSLVRAGRVEGQGDACVRLCHLPRQSGLLRLWNGDATFRCLGSSGAAAFERDSNIHVGA